MDFQVRRLVSHEFFLDERELSIQDNPVLTELADKLLAEEARLRRLAPEPPRGWVWDYVVQKHNDPLSFQIEYRVIGKLKEI